MRNPLQTAVSPCKEAVFLLLVRTAAAVIPTPLGRQNLALAVKFTRHIDGEQDDINACGTEDTGLH